MPDPIHPSFAAFMEAFVPPRMIEPPDHVQLDGKIVGGKVWKAHEDCRYEPCSSRTGR